DGVGAIGRAGGKYAVETLLRVRARKDLQGFTTSLMQPGEDDDLVARAKAMEAFNGKGVNFKPGVGRTFRALSRGVFAVFESGADDADGAKERAGFLGWVHAIEMLSHPLRPRSYLERDTVWWAAKDGAPAWRAEISS